MTEIIPTCYVIIDNDDGRYLATKKTMEDVIEFIKMQSSCIGKLRIMYNYDKNRPIRAQVEILDVDYYFNVGSFETYEVDIVYLV